jgi:hypothetical protein
MKIIGYAVLILLVLAILVLLPFGLIWSINTLFSLSIAYTIKNWLAAILLIIIMGGKSNGITFKKTKSSCCRK